MQQKYLKKNTKNMLQRVTSFYVCVFCCVYFTMSQKAVALQKHDCKIKILVLIQRAWLTILHSSKNHSGE